LIPATGEGSAVAVPPYLNHHGRVKPASSPTPRVRASARPLALALLGLLLGACPQGTGDDDGAETTTTSGEIASPLCTMYVACVAEVNPAGLSEIDGRLGETGMCWGQAITDQAECVDECTAGLSKANLDFPSSEACEPPKDLSDAVFEIGQAIFDPDDPFADPVWAPLANGGTLEMVRGGQGLLMFPVGLRGANFITADDPGDFGDPKMPQVDMWVDIDGYNIGFAGHFARIYNYPIPFRPLAGADGIFEFLYIAVIVPDEISDPFVLNGKAGHIWIELFPYEEASILRELDVTIVVADPSI